MSQYDFGTIDPYTDDGVTLADMLNNWRDAVHSWHRGAARPSYAVPGMAWINDTGGPTNWLVMVYLGPSVGDLVLFTYDTTTGVITASAAMLLAQSATNPSMRWNATGNAADVKAWRATVPVGGTLRFGAYNDAGVEVGAITFNRDGKLIADLSLATGLPPQGVFIGTAPPGSPLVGQQWWKSDDGVMYLRYDDGNSVQWVPAAPQAAPPPSSAWTLINRQVLGGTAASIIVDGLAGYRAIKVLASLVPSVTNVAPVLRVRKGGAAFSDANYSQSYSYSNSTGTTAGLYQSALTGWNLGGILVDANPRGGGIVEATFNDITRAGVWQRAHFTCDFDGLSAGAMTLSGSLIYGTPANLPLDGLQFDAVGGQFAAGSSMFVTGMK